MEDRAYKIVDTTATKKIFQMRKRIRAVAGGTSASKTVSILIWLIDYAQSTKDQLLSIVSESFPHLEKGAILDFKAIMKDRGYWDENRWNETKHQYTYETGSIIEFFSSDVDKAHGPRRDILFLNEAQNLPYNEVDQLIIRTRKIVWMDWNPTNEFYFYTEPRFKQDDVSFITLTYLDNEALDEVTIREIEAHKHQKGWWQVYGLGQLGEVEGRIYKDWRLIDSIPHEARLEVYGLDFGYHPDPAAIVAIYYWNGGYVLDQVLYQRETSNAELAKYLKNLPEKRVLADSAEPKSIAEIRTFGVPIIPVPKGADSKRSGIKFVQSQRISVTRQSVELIKEYRNYLWKVDKDGRVVMGETDEKCADHALDAVRYAFTSLVTAHNSREQDTYYRNNYAYLMGDDKETNPAR